MENKRVYDYAYVCDDFAAKVQDMKSVQFICCFSFHRIYHDDLFAFAPLPYLTCQRKLARTDKDSSTVYLEKAENAGTTTYNETPCDEQPNEPVETTVRSVNEELMSHAHAITWNGIEITMPAGPLPLG
jgi:aconitase A